MRFEYIVLLIIAFNVITALMQRRAKKAREKALRESGSVPEGSSFPGNAGEEGWGEPVEARDPRGWRRGAEPAEDAPQKMPGFGRDILDQIARDLGLKPAPAPRAEPRSEARRSEERRLEARPAAERRAEARLVAERRAESSPAESRRSAAGRESVPIPRKFTPVPQPLASVATAVEVRASLRGPQRLREAFVLKEILDAPVSRRDPRGRLFQARSTNP